ncbi:hypothetical protein [Conservatibacter flavescens]|uniref:Uncharacterized protein n=1 Tax=Conservatibacter flavescens TaxID=28161 RepID=A0A2M8S0X0_9PAST|nr:hypothetical protein [Conservatibacter flavescens]PJG84787.1 hypothetical protein CVP05_09625 [Conservatibacter flavescens]
MKPYLLNKLKEIECELSDYRPQIYASIKKVAKNGLSREIAFYIVLDGEIENISEVIADELNLPVVTTLGSDTIKISGCGEDMVWNTLYHYYKQKFGRSAPAYRSL